MGETIPETIAAAVVVATEAVSDVVEVSMTAEQYYLLVDYINLIAGIMLFFAVVVLCYFGYKFLRMFF